MWTGKNLVLMFKGNNFAGFLATLGVSIKNLMRERERNVEQVFRKISSIANSFFLLIFRQ
jgi:hypothetical protein